MLGEKKWNGPAGAWNNTLSPKNLSSPPKIKFLNESCLLWNQQPIRNKNKRWLAENKNGSMKAFCRSVSDNKSIKKQQVL